MIQFLKEKCQSTGMISITNSDYEIIKVLYESNEYVSILLARDKKHSKEVVFKVFSRNIPNFSVMQEEMRIQQLLNHPNIVPVLDILYEKEFIIVIYPYYKLGDMLDVVKSKSLQPESILRIFSQVIDGICYLHDHNYAHLDIKPENILLSENWTPALSDFGSVESPVSRERGIRARGTLYYAAPEMLDHYEYDNKKADIWELGITLYALTTKHLPWTGGTDSQIIEQIKLGEIGETSFLPFSIRRIVEMCCRLNPVDRPTAKQLSDFVAKYVHKFSPKGSIKKEKSQIRPAKSILFGNSNPSRNRTITMQKSLPAPKFFNELF